MSVNRYECGLTNAPTEYQSPTMHQDANGGYVSYEDYAALEQKLAESQREFRAADATIENLQMELNAEREAKLALAAESEERRQFILNGVEFGYIRLPDEDTADSAKAIYERCLSVGKYTPCQKCNDTGMTDSGGTQPWGEPIEIECDCLAAKIRKGVQP